MSEYIHKDEAGLREYEQTPLHERVSVSNTYDLIKQGAAINPDAKAVSFIPSGQNYEADSHYTYAQLLHNINQCANFLHDLGVGPKDVVSYLLPNFPQTHFALWGAEATGIANPINFMLEPATIRDICQAANTKVLIALGDYPGFDIWQKVEAIRGDLPNLKAIIRGLGPSDEKNGIYGFDEHRHKYNGDKLNSGRLIDPEDISSIFHTGGTTGTPKLAPRTHYSETINAVQTAMGNDLKTGETILSGLPLFHVNGANVTGTATFHIGGHVVILSPLGYRDPGVIKNFYKIVERFKAVTFSAVPTVLAMMLDVPQQGEDISSLRYAVCGAAPLSVELFNRFQEYTGLKILEGYGLTEGVCVSALNPLAGERKVGSIGLRIPYQSMDVFIVDEEGKFVRRAEQDEIGSVCISGPNVFKGYMDPRHNVGIHPKEGWFNTGDLGKRDKDGYFWLTGRKKELIIRGGHNIDPAMIEEPLYRLAGVQVAAAVGRPDPHAGEVPVAYVQIQAGSDLTPEKIMAHLKDNIGERAAMPKEVVILDALPLTPVGKLFKPAMRWDAIRRVYQNELTEVAGQVADLKISVGEDKVHGTLVELFVELGDADKAAVEKAISDILANYTLALQVTYL